MQCSDSQFIFSSFACKYFCFTFYFTHESGRREEEKCIADDDVHNRHSHRSGGCTVRLGSLLSGLWVGSILVSCDEMVHVSVSWP